jgi:hypothetical protein
MNGVKGLILNAKIQMSNECQISKSYFFNSLTLGLLWRFTSPVLKSRQGFQSGGFLNAD